MYTRFKNNTVKIVVVVLSLVVADACPDFIQFDQLKLNNNSHLSVVEKCINAIYSTVVNIKHCTDKDDNNNADNEEDSLKIDEFIVKEFFQLSPTHSHVEHLTPLPFVLVKDVHIEIVPPPPLVLS